MKYLHITDYDDTLMPRNSKEQPDLAADNIDAYRRFMAAHPEIGIVYSSGRIASNILKMIERDNLPEPAFVIGGVGTEIYDFKKRRLLPDFDAYMKKAKWDFATVRETLSYLPSQPDEQQGEYKVCYFAENLSEDDIKAIEGKLLERGVKARGVYSSARYLDIIPAVTDKGFAAKHLIKHLGMDSKDVVISDDSLNDVDMFHGSFGLKVVPNNAEEALLERIKNQKNLYRASGNVAFGVIEGLAYFLGKNKK